jgi:hypothetical protein
MNIAMMMGIGRLNGELRSTRRETTHPGNRQAGQHSHRPIFAQSTGSLVSELDNGSASKIKLGGRRRRALHEADNRSMNLTTSADVSYTPLSAFNGMFPRQFS